MKKELLAFIEEVAVWDVDAKLTVVPAELLTKKIEETCAFEETAQEDFKNWFLENNDAIVDSIQAELDAWKIRHNIPKVALPNNLAKIDSVDVDELNYNITESVKIGLLNVLDTRTI